MAALYFTNGDGTHQTIDMHLLFLLLILLNMPTHTENSPQDSAGKLRLDISGDESNCPCGTCDRPVTWSHHGLACGTCGQWYHAHCQSVGDETYGTLAAPELSWNCATCHTVNHSRYAYDLHGLDLDACPAPHTPVPACVTTSTCTNSYATYSSLHDPSISPSHNHGNAFKPYHTSTPTKISSVQNSNRFRPLRLININFRSVAGKKPELSNLLHDMKPDIVCGTETWLDNTIASSEIFPHNYKVYRKDRNREGGGVCIAVADYLSSTEEPTLNVESTEIIWVKIKIKCKTDLLISSFYRPHVTDTASIDGLLESTRLASQFRSAILVIGGDFNFPDWDWKTMTLKQGCSQPRLHQNFADYMDDYSLEQMVHFPIRGRNTLDLFLTTHPNLVQRTEPGPGLSDHDLVYMELQLQFPCKQIPARPVPMYKKANWVDLKHSVREISRSITDCVDPGDTNNMWTKLKEGVLAAVSKHVPHRTIKPSKDQPWVSWETKKLIRKRDKAHKRWKKTASIEAKNKFHDLKRQVQKQLRQQYWQYLEGTFTDATSNENPKPNKLFWRHVKASRTEGVGLSALKEGGCLITDPKLQSEVLNTQFRSVFSPKISITEEEFDQRCPPTHAPYPKCEDINISIEGVCKLLMNLDPNKACGPDGLSPRILKETAIEIAPALTAIFRSSLTSGNVPEDWRTAYVTPVYKKGERYKPENYRPISLTSIPCKIMEHIVVSHIMNHAENHNIIGSEQHGFRKGRSCETQLLGLMDELSEEVEQGAQVDMLVMDFSKAFDKVSHSLLLHKLKRYGITGQVHTWITGFLTDRRQSVVIDGINSDFCPVESGVPQGSVLGPSLFLFYINDIPVGISSKVRLFADDTTCYQAIRSSEDQQSLQQDLNRLAEWEQTWSMAFHPQKCSVLCITKNKTTRTPTYTLHGHLLEQVNNVKYLGITISKDLKWNAHIDNTRNKASRTLGFLRRNLKISNKKIKDTAYKALVRPSLEYASSVWDPHTIQHSTALEKVQRRAARWVSHSYRQRSSVDSMLQTLNWPTLQLRRKRARLCNFYKHHNRLCSIDTKFAPRRQPERQRATRHSHDQGYQQLYHRTKYRQMSFFPRTVIEWNSLPPWTVHSTSLDMFRFRLELSPQPQH